MIRHLLLTGGPTHPFAETAPMLEALLAEAGIATTTETDVDAVLARLRADQLGEGEPIDLLTVHALRWSMTQERYAAQRADHAVTLGDDDLAVVDRFVRRGGGLLALHTAVICFDGHPRWRALCGASWDWDRSTHPPRGPVRVEPTAAGRLHPLTHDLEGFTVDDEAYGFLDEVDDLEALLTAEHGGRAHPLLWARTVGHGRVVTDLLGHGPPAFDHPTHRTVLIRAATWAAGAPRPDDPAKSHP